MLKVSQLFEREFEKMKNRGWEHIYVIVDMHDTVFESTYENDAPLEDYLYAVETLQILTKRKDTKLIYWSSTFGSERARHFKFLADKGIFFNYINDNPAEKSNDYSNFEDKFYMNIILDDKAGFDPTKDWNELYLYLKRLEIDEENERDAE